MKSHVARSEPPSPWFVRYHDYDLKAYLGIEIVKVDGKKPRKNRDGYITTESVPTEFKILVGQVDQQSSKINNPEAYEFVAKLQPDKSYLQKISFEGGELQIWLGDAESDQTASPAVITQIHPNNILALAIKRERARNDRAKQVNDRPLTVEQEIKIRDAQEQYDRQNRL